MNNESWFKNSDNQFSSFSWNGEENMSNNNQTNDSNNIVWQMRDFCGQSVIQPCHGKRKGSYESFHPVTKQLITEARIANSLQKMSLGQDSTDELHSPKLSSFSKGQDEGFEELDAFETDSENEDIVLDVSADSKSSSQFPQFYVHDDLKKEFARIDKSILPNEIVKSINQSALALVLYEPIENILLKTFKQNQEKTKENKANKTNEDKGSAINCEPLEPVENFVSKAEGMEFYPIEDETMAE